MLTPETATNWASIEHGVRLVDFSSQVEECEAEHVLDTAVNSIWLTKEGLPQWLCFSLLDASKLQELQIKTVGWHCWHAYTTNPKSVTLHVSSDGSKFRRWDTFTVEAASDQVQLFYCAPISPKVYPYIAFEVTSTFGGDQTYLNRIYLFTDEVSHPLAPDASIRSPSSTLDTESLMHVLDQAMNTSGEVSPEVPNDAPGPYRLSHTSLGIAYPHSPSVTGIAADSGMHALSPSRHSSSKSHPTPPTDHSNISSSNDAMLRILKLENRIDELMCELHQLRAAPQLDGVTISEDALRNNTCSSNQETETPKQLRHTGTCTDNSYDTTTAINGSTSTIETLTQSIRHIESLIRTSHDISQKSSPDSSRSSPQKTSHIISQKSSPDSCHEASQKSSPESFHATLRKSSPGVSHEIISQKSSPHASHKAFQFRPQPSEEPLIPPSLSRRDAALRNTKDGVAYMVSSHSGKGPGGHLRNNTDLALHPQSTSISITQLHAHVDTNLRPSSSPAPHPHSSTIDDEVYRITAKLHDKLLQRTIKEAQLRVIRENKAKRKAQQQSLC